MKPREIWKVAAKREWTEGWLCVNRKSKDYRSPEIVFFITPKPSIERDGCWRSRLGSFGSWSKGEWRAVYGSARLPKYGKCERVRLELREGES